MMKYIGTWHPYFSVVDVKVVENDIPGDWTKIMSLCADRSFRKMSHDDKLEDSCNVFPKNLISPLLVQNQKYE